MDIEYRGIKIGRGPESQPNYQSKNQPLTAQEHAPGCKIPPEARAMREKGKDRIDVGLQRDFEPTVLTHCGMKVLKCWLPAHWDVCAESKGKCFVPQPRAL